MDILIQYLITFGWAITGAVSMGLSIGIAIKIFDWISPIDEWAEIRKENMSMAIVLGALILGTALVISLIVMA